MRRLAPFDKALVLVLVPLWAGCFLLCLRSVVTQAGFSPVYVSVSDPHPYPTVSGFRPDLPVEASGLRIGDRLIRIGESDLRGVGPLGFHARVTGEASSQRRVPVVLERRGQRLEATLAAASHFVDWPLLPVSFVFAATGLFLFLRATPSLLSRSLFGCFFCIAIVFSSMFGGSTAAGYASIAIHAISFTLIAPLILRAVLLFPHGRPPESLGGRFGPWLFVILGPLDLSFDHGLLLPPDGGFRALFAVLLVLFATVLTIGTRTYRRADAVERRQLKWVLLGLYLALVPMIGTAAWVTFDPRVQLAFVASQSAMALVPISILIAIARYNLLDIDRVISGAASFHILVVLLGGSAPLIVPPLAEVASDTVGLDARVGQSVLSLLLVALAIRLHRRLRPQIDRLFFRDRYALDRGVPDLLAALSRCANSRELLEQAGRGLKRLLRPESCVVYALVEGAWVPVFVEGRTAPPAFGTDSVLLTGLQERRGPLAFGEAGGWRPDVALDAFDRAALESLEAAVIVPARHGTRMAAFLCLGPKHSGDIYASSDLSLLAAVGEKLSTELRRFDQEQVLREAQAMQESLRRYVPGAVAEELAGGSELVSGEREVSVLFVDIRGYTSFSEGRRAEEIFSTVNRYTETVSEIVRRHAGSVVEFNGDGMMAVFGVPRELAHKERAAVDAGREIIEAVGALPIERGEPLSVGVGIATGAAYVGNIRAVDRVIWSAIGNTTNLAARLQGLTRDLDASMVIDAATWQRAETAASAFERRSEVPIRGRRESQDVYALLPSSGS